MNRSAAITFVVFAGFGLVCLHGGVIQAQEGAADSGGAVVSIPETMVWYHDIGQAAQRASEADLQLMVYFYTDWSHWCDSMEAVTLNKEQVINLQGRLVFVRVNPETDTAAATKYGIRRYPTCVLLTKEGNEVDRITGFVNADEFVDMTNDYLAGRETLWELEQRQQQNNRDTKLMVEVAKKKMNRGNFEDARTLLERAIQMDARNETETAAEAAFTIARMDREKRNWYKAIEGFRTLVKSFPKSKYRRDAELYIPWLYAQAGDTASAVRHYETFLDEHGGSKSAKWIKKQLTKLQPPEQSNMSDDTAKP